MNKIITVTLNPSLDETLITNHLNIGYRNHVADNKRLDASGRGVNVSSALAHLQTPSEALVMLGNDSISRAYKGLINEEDFVTKIILRQGSTRSDTIIVDIGDKTETHLIDEVSVDAQEDFQKFISALKQMIDVDDRVVFAGNIPRDTPSDIYAQLIEVVHQSGAKAVVMTKGEALKQALRSAPDMVILTPLEAEYQFNYPVRTEVDMISSARKLHERGCKDVLIVRDDYTGAIFVSGEEAWSVEIAEAGLSGTSSGVIDAMLAGYLAAIVNGKKPEQALELGASAMAFAIEQVGNEFGTPDQLQAHLTKVAVKHIGLEGANAS